MAAAGTCSLCCVPSDQSHEHFPAGSEVVLHLIQASGCLLSTHEAIAVALCWAQMLFLVLRHSCWVGTVVISTLFTYRVSTACQSLSECQGSAVNRHRKRSLTLLVQGRLLQCMANIHCCFLHRNDTEMIFLDGYKLKTAPSVSQLANLANM